MDGRSFRCSHLLPGECGLGRLLFLDPGRAYERLPLRHIGADAGRKFVGGARRGVVATLDVDVTQFEMLSRFGNRNAQAL